MKKLLIIIGVTIGLTIRTFAGPIHDAASRGEAEKLKQLIDSGADINSLDESGVAPLHISCFWSSVPSKFLDCFNYLISAGANVNIRARDGQTPLHFVAENLSTTDRGSIQFTTLLVKGADINIAAYNGTTVLQTAAGRSIKFTELLLAYGADINKKGFKGRSALHFAKNKDMVDFLLSKGAMINAVDDEGRTVLTLHDKELCEHFLVRGADPNIKDIYGLSVLDRAYRDSDMDDIIPVLKKHGAKSQEDELSDRLNKVEQKVDQLSTGTTNPTDEWPRKMWEIDLGIGVRDRTIRDLSRVELGSDNSVLFRVYWDTGLFSALWVTSNGKSHQFEDNVDDDNLIYLDGNNLIYTKNSDEIVKLSRDQEKILKSGTSKLNGNNTLSSPGWDSPEMPIVQVSWEGSKLTGWDLTPPSSTAPKPDDGNGGGNGGGNETVDSQLTINTAGPDIALATDGKLGAAELQKSNDLRIWRKLGDVPAEASEVLVTPRESGNEFFRLKKKE